MARTCKSCGKPYDYEGSPLLPDTCTPCVMLAIERQANESDAKMVRYLRSHPAYRATEDRKREALLVNLSAAAE